MISYKKLIKAFGFQFKEEEEPFDCCGFCGVFSFKNPEISARIWQRKNRKIKESEASLIVTDCPGCLFQLRSNLRKENPSFQILHTAELCSGAVDKEP